MRVELLDWMGSENSIIEAARISYGKGTQLKSSDTGLIRYLWRKRHTSPFEMIETKWRFDIPLFVAMQIATHRTSRFASRNQMSGRYSEMDIEFMDVTEWRKADANLKQGSSEDTVTYKNHSQQIAFDEYRKMLELGICREQARMVLPMSTYTAMIWKIDLHNLLHFLELRLDPHAQKETRWVAEQMAAVVKERCPTVWAAFEDYNIEALTFSRQEIDALVSGEEAKLSKGEQSEFELKRGRIGW